MDDSVHSKMAGPDAGDMAVPVKKARLGKTRVGLAIVLCVPLLLSVIVATSVRFTGGRILSTEAFATYTEKALDDPAVDDAVGEVIGDKVLDVLDENHQKSDKAREAIKSAAATVLTSDEGRAIAASIFARTHAAFIDIAERDDLEGDETLTVDFTPLVYRAVLAVAESEAFTFRTKLPAVDSLPDDAAMLEAISKAVGHSLGEKAASVKVIDQKEDGSDTAFVAVHDILSAYHDGVTASTVLAVLLALAVVFLFVRRRVGVIVVSSIVLAASFVPWNILGGVPGMISDEIDDERGRAVATAFVEPLVSDVRSRLVLVVVLAIGGILVGSFWVRIAGLVKKKG